MAAVIENIRTTTDTAYLLNLITDDLLQNYKEFIKSEVVVSTFDYTTLANKTAYDNFSNSSVVTVSGNIETKVDRVKSIITYVKQYTVGNNSLRNYTYRVLKEEQAIVASANATSTISPAVFSTSIQTTEQVFTLHLLKTITTQTFNTNLRDDFLNMPIIFASDREIAPPVNSTNYALRSMLLNYYSNQITNNYTGPFVLGASVALGAFALSIGFTWSFFALFIAINIVPIFLAFYNDYNVLDFMLNNYLLFSGVVGIGVTIVYELNRMIKYDPKSILSTRA